MDGNGTTYRGEMLWAAIEDLETAAGWGTTRAGPRNSGCRRMPVWSV